MGRKGSTKRSFGRPEKDNLTSTSFSSPRANIFGNPQRVSLYKSSVEIDDQGNILNLDVQKDNKKIYFVLFDNHVKN